MKQSFGQKGAGGHFLALALALIMLCSVLVPAYAAVVDEQGVAEQNEPAATGSVTYIFHVGETVQEVKVASGEALTKPTDPDAPEGEVFKGWFVDNDLNKPFTFGTTVSTHADEAVHLYAHFETAVAASTEQQPAAPEQPAAPGTSEEPKQPETNTATDGGEENKDEQGSTENNENQTGENQNTENNGENTGDTTTPSDPTTPTDPVTPVEPIIPAEPQPAEALPAEENPEGEQIIYTTDAQTVEELYDRLMAAASLEEMNSLLENLTEAQNELLNQFDEAKNTALTAKMDELGAYDFNTLDDTAHEIEQGATLDFQVANSGTNSVYISFYSSDPQSAELTVKAYNNFSLNDSSKGFSISASDNAALGDYTLTINYYYGVQQRTAVVKVKVTEAKAQVFYLISPDANAKSNDTSIWGKAIQSGLVDTAGATWEDGDGGEKKNIYSPIPYVKGMPVGMTQLEDGSGAWLMPNTETYATHYEAIFKAYQKKLADALKISADELKQSDITAIYLTPFKISRNNPDKHIDCTVSIKTNGFYAARFWVDLPNGGGNFDLIETQHHRTAEEITKTTLAPNNGKYAETLTVNGVTYVFDGWYKNDQWFQSENKVSYKDNTKWPYSPSENDLITGSVDFYAHYVPKTTSLTVKKEIGGNLVTSGGTFAFTYTVKDKEGKEVQPAEGETYTFTLSTENNYTYTIDNLPVGATVTLRETNADAYHTWYQDSQTFDKDDRGTESEDKQHTTPALVSGDNYVVCYNEKDIIPDTGILLDSWPYLLALCFVTLGAVVTLAHKRRRDVD